VHTVRRELLEVEVLGRDVRATVSSDVLVDPRGERMRA